MKGDVGLMTYHDLQEFVANGSIYSKDDNHLIADQIGPSSVDLTFHGRVLAEVYPKEHEKGETYPTLDLGHRDTLAFEETLATEDEPFLLYPGAFAIAQSRELFKLPADISGIYCASSTMSRMGLSTLNPHWLSAGWRGSSLAIELHNASQYHVIALRPGVKIGQVCLWRHDALPQNRIYNGAYSDEPMATAAHIKGK